MHQNFLHNSFCSFRLNKSKAEFIDMVPLKNVLNLECKGWNQMIARLLADHLIFRYKMWNQIICIITQFTPHPLGDEGVEPFFRTFTQERLRSNQGFGWELALQVGVIFFRWDLKTLYKKQQIQISSKKNDSDCNFYNLSPLVP